MSYEHGIRVQETKSAKATTVNGTSGLQVIFGTAPINKVANPQDVVNKVVLVNSFEEAVEKFGYSEDFNNYTLCQSMYACFKLFHVSPVIFCNVLDPSVHKTALTETTYSVANKSATVPVEGIILSDLVVKNDATNLTVDTDYIVTMNDEGYPVITLLTSGSAASATEIKVSGNKLNPSAVTASDIIGGYDSETGKETGMELVRQVYPRFGMVPGLLVAPGWSKDETVSAVMDAKCTEINGVFNCECVVDISTADATKYTDVPTVKDDNGVNGEHTIALWPMVIVNNKILSYSAVYAAMLAYMDVTNGDVPSLSSNVMLNVDGTVLADGTEVYIDEVMANTLNAKGIVTAINTNGYRSWGNNMASYPSVDDPKDRWINCRRFFSWWGNTFIVTYKEKVDKPGNYKLIESLVDSENIRGNSLTSQGKCAGAKIEFNADENPVETIISGKLVFRQYLAPFTPAEDILNILSFDPSMIVAALGGE